MNIKNNTWSKTESCGFWLPTYTVLLKVFGPQLKIAVISMVIAGIQIPIWDILVCFVHQCNMVKAILYGFHKKLFSLKHGNLYETCYWSCSKT